MQKYKVAAPPREQVVLDTHPESCEPEGFSKWISSLEGRDDRPKAIDLFSGAGGLSKGLEMAGWNVVASVDHDKRALETHRANFGGVSLDTDMFDDRAIEEFINLLAGVDIDLVAGGPPCQPFSRAGRAKIRSLVRDHNRDAYDTRKDLWESFVNVVTALKPRAVIMENVPDLAIGDDTRLIRKIADRFEKLGYLVEYRLLDAWKYGVPQHRRRLILQARSDGKAITWPQPSAPTTVREAIADLPKLEKSTGKLKMSYEAVDISKYVEQLRNGADPDHIYDHVTRSVRADDYEAFSLMTSKTLYSDLPAHLRRYRTDIFNDKYKRLGWDEHSRTITAHIAKDGYWYIHPEEHRTLTVREAARLQSFPDGFRFAGYRSDAFRQIGNAVPPLLGKAVGVELISDNPTQVIGEVVRLREALSTWAAEEAKKRWWLFPGPNMSPVRALAIAHLGLHAMSDARAAAFAYVIARHRTFDKMVEDLLTSVKYSAAQLRKLSELSALGSTVVTEDQVDEVANTSLSGQAERIYQMLTRESPVILNARSRRAGEILLKSDSLGDTATEAKVVIARLVGFGEESDMRMAALLSLDERSAHAIRNGVP